MRKSNVFVLSSVLEVFPDIYLDESLKLITSDTSKWIFSNWIDGTQDKSNLKYHKVKLPFGSHVFCHPYKSGFVIGICFRHKSLTKNKDKYAYVHKAIVASEDFSLDGLAKARKFLNKLFDKSAVVPMMKALMLHADNSQITRKKKSRRKKVAQ